MEKKFKKIRTRALRQFKDCSGSEDLEQLKIEYLGRNGKVNKLFKELKNLDDSLKPKWGKKLNSFKNELEQKVKAIRKKLEESKKQKDYFDPTLPPDGRIKYSPPHILTRVLNDITDIFVSMGFGVAYGPDIETNYYNFTALNFPADHPARDMHDTFYLEKPDSLLRTHTSPVQVRGMEKKSPPYKFIAPGQCYRRDTIDASHSPVFHQVEGLLVDKKVTFTDLKGVLHEFADRFFDRKVSTRFRPSYFPFTEPSAEMDIACGLCGGEGCSSCSNKGWLEILGAGMVDPEVFNFCDVDVEKWQGFAFGMGVERLAMLKYNINDMRLFYSNDLRFLEQF
ncbi:MAG: phenylalanine--tRNA ligase subunit alpha [Elusimicrobiota bacterium]